MMVWPSLASADPISADQRVERDVRLHDDAQADVDTQTSLLPITIRRVAVLRAAWDRAVAGGHPVDAGRFAQAHFAALQDRRAVRIALARAEATLATANDTLALDRVHLQLEARIDSLLSRPRTRLPR